MAAWMQKYVSDDVKYTPYGVSMTTWYIHTYMYLPTTFSGCDRFRSTVVPLLSSALHVYTPSSSESTLHRLWVKGILEHSFWEATITPLRSHFREETEVKLEKKKRRVDYQWKKGESLDRYIWSRFQSFLVPCRCKAAYMTVYLASLLHFTASSKFINSIKNFCTCFFIPCSRDLPLASFFARK